MSEEGNWVECVVDSDYEIFSEYPYPIRRKGSDKIIKESIKNGDGYVRCSLNGKTFYKHRIIGQQFIENDEPETKTVIDHIDHNRANNHKDNLRWTTQSNNTKNRKACRSRQFVLLDELPESAEPLDSYNGHDIDGLFVDYDNEKLYLFNGVKYRELVPCRQKCYIYYNIQDIENKQLHLCHKTLFG